MIIPRKFHAASTLIVKGFNLLLYYAVLRKLPYSTTPLIGRMCEFLRLRCCKHIFLKCGIKVNVETNARFGDGKEIEIGDWSSIGVNADTSNRTKIGKYVMMGHNCIIIGANHKYDSTEIPIISQGSLIYDPVVIEDDVWIGHNVIITPGRKIRKGTILAAGTVLTKNFPAYSIVGGNPGVLLRMRQ